MSKYIYIINTIIFTVYGQLVLKWRLSQCGELPSSIEDKIIALLKLLLDPFILSGFISAFLAALCWMVTLTKFELSYAYPFMGLTFVVVLLLSSILFQEVINAHKVIGIILIVVGIVIGSQS